MEFVIKENKLMFSGLDAGNIEDGKVTFNFDVLRQIVVRSSWFATGRKIEDRTLTELREDVLKFVESRNEATDTGTKKIEELKRELHNRDSIIQAYQNRCDKQNIEINEWRNRFVETARALQEYQQSE
jgi:hypothetical protein